MTEVVVAAAVESLVAVAAGMTRNVVADVVEDQTSHYWPDFSEASAAEIHFDPLPLSQSQKLPRIVLYTASLVITWCRCAVRLSPPLHVWGRPAGLPAPTVRPPRLRLRVLPPLTPAPVLVSPRGRGGAPTRRWSPEPHLPPDAAVSPYDGPGDVDRAPVPRLEGGGAGRGAGRKIIKYAHMEIGMC